MTPSTLIDLDWLALDLPGSVRPGDFVMIDKVGAYSIDMNSSFIDPPLPVLVKRGDSWATARHAPTFEEALAGYTW